MAVFLQTTMVLYPLRYVACIVTLALGAYLLAITLLNEVTADIKAIDDDTDIAWKFSELIDLHSDAKQ